MSNWLGAEEFEAYLAQCLHAVRDEITRWIPAHTRVQRELYDLVLDYPFREAKGLRPALCLAACCGLGGLREAALPSAAVLELYHNAFLVHDDVEDGSLERRGGSALHQQWGAPIAINVGDAMLALTLRPLLCNTELIGLTRALKVLQAISDMTLTSVEGQALELHWTRHGLAQLDDAQYLNMVRKKTAHYSFISPLQIGALIAGLDGGPVDELGALGDALGIAFQIQDDLLNFEAPSAYGKEVAGDVWEGKYTLPLLHALRSSQGHELQQAQMLLSKARPDAKAPKAGDKSVQDVRWLLAWIERHGGRRHAAQVAQHWAGIAQQRFSALQGWFGPSQHRAFLGYVVNYVVTRSR